jgi:signal transduction histidine kinase
VARPIGGGRYAVATGSLGRLRDAQIRDVYPEEDGVVWLLGLDALVRYDARAKGAAVAAPTPLFRRVSAGDRLFYDGAGALIEAEVPPNAGVVRFAFAAPSFGGVRYRTRLDGLEDGWTAWGPATEREFAGLGPGHYRLRVQAQDAGGEPSPEAAYAFTILPPWWRAWWAYAMYALLFVAAALAVDRVQRRRLTARERARGEAERIRLRAEAAEAQAQALKAENDRQEAELAKARELEAAYTQLQGAQAQLVHAEKLASLGRLTAGIAHEIKNPLNFVNNFAEMNAELVGELRQVLASHRDRLDGEVDGLLDDLTANAQMIEEHGKRADGIVRSMLAHSRSGSGPRRRIALNALVEEYGNHAYHAARAKDAAFEVALTYALDPAAGDVEVVADEIGRLLLNLLGNAFDAVRERAGHAAPGYVPTVTVATRRRPGAVEVRVSDNGVGIPAAARGRLFEPFFTTKPPGQGTGLGLSLSHDVAVAHGGTLGVESGEGTGATFTFTLPDTVIPVLAAGMEPGGRQS